MPDFFLLEGAPTWYAITMRILLTLGAVGFTISAALWALAGFKYLSEKLPFWHGFAAGAITGFSVALGILFLMACVLAATKAG